MFIITALWTTLFAWMPAKFQIFFLILFSFMALLIVFKVIAFFLKLKFW